MNPSKSHNQQSSVKFDILLPVERVIQTLHKFFLRSIRIKDRLSTNKKQCSVVSYLIKQVNRSNDSNILSNNSDAVLLSVHNVYDAHQFLPRCM